MPKQRTIIGFGYEARSGKDSCCSYLKCAFKGSKILVTSFAKKLRKEIHSEMYQIVANEHVSPREALEIMCLRAGVPYDPFAIRDENNYHGKQRRLQQWWGTEYRRAQSASYWLDAVSDEIEASDADFILISDMRFINEANWITSQNGHTVHVLRPDLRDLKGPAATHISEHELRGYPFSHSILNDGSLKLLHERADALFRSIR